MYYLYCGVLSVLFSALAVAQAPFAEPYDQDSLPDGVVAIEAEHFHVNNNSATHAWVVRNDVKYSGGKAMQADPDTGTFYSQGPDAAGVSCVLSYDINFVHTGTNYIVLRGFGPNSNADSCHAALDAQIDTSDRIGSFRSSGEWEENTSDGHAAYVVVPSTGIHTLHLYFREDGVILDKILISTNPNFLPDDDSFGPPTSLQGTNVSDEVQGDLVITDIVLTNGMVEAHFTPMAHAASYQGLEAPHVGMPLSVDDDSVAYGFKVTSPISNQFQILSVMGTQMSSNETAAGTVLNRLAYGPTPDEWQRVYYGGSPIGASGFIAEQLNPEAISDSADSEATIQALKAKIEQGAASISDLRAWYLLRAVASERQLTEVLLQFINNHFVTYFYKTRDWARDEGFASSNTDGEYLASLLEFQELERWREVLLDPNGTFLDLLTISAESPAMIIFLDTVTNDKAAPNENYARELIELFSMGVDNGYTQADIEELARVWTGWRVGTVAPADAGDLFVNQGTNINYIVSPAGTWDYMKGLVAPSNNWNQLGFSPGTNWLSGVGPLGYGDGDDNTELLDMEDSYSTVFARQEFTLNNPSVFSNLTVRAYVDDGGIVYLNGAELGRVAVDEGVVKGHADFADDSHEAAWENFAVTNAGSLLISGTNVIAVHGLNRNLGSSDFSLDAALLEPVVWQPYFDVAAHDESNKTVFAGRSVDTRFGAPWADTSYELVIPARLGQAGIQDGYDVLDHLANLPYTREYMAVKLCQLLVHDDFILGGYYNISNNSDEEKLVRTVMEAWELNGPDGRKGNLRNIIGAIVNSELFHSQSAARHKVKTPMEFVVSAIRALRTPLGGGGVGSATDGYDLIAPMGRMGMNVFANFSPDGWPEVGGEWVDTSTMAERMRFIQNYLMDDADALKAVDFGSSSIHNVSDPVAVLADRLTLPEQSDAAAIVDFFIQLLYPDEGLANLDLDATICIALLNSDALGNVSSFSSLGLGSAVYEERVRALVGLLLGSPRFSEQ